MKEFKIEKIKLKDWDEFYPFFVKMMKEDFPKFSPLGKKYLLESKYPNLKFAEKVKKGRLGVLVLRDNQQKLGGFLIFEPDAGGVMFLNWVVVVKEWRGQGLGRRLVEEWEKITPRANFHKLAIATNDRDNLGFYKKMGYRLEGFLKEDYWGKDKYVLGKILCD